MPEPPFRVIGRYALCNEIAAGGMATVHIGRLLGAAGFNRTVAIKRLHRHLCSDPDFAAMFVDEARLAARLRHPNVVPTLDVVESDGELFLVMEYVEGESLARLIRACKLRGELAPPRVVSAIVINALEGLHSAHEARSEQGEPLGIVHRDVSPQNILVGVDGVARVLDFGIAKATNRAQATGKGEIKGKLAYMPPEQIRGLDVDRRVDVFAACVVLWEALAGQKPFDAPDEVSLLNTMLNQPLPLASAARDIPAEVYGLLARGMSRRPEGRWATAYDMLVALERALPPASPREVAAWVAQLSGDKLMQRAALIKEIESSRSLGLVVPAVEESPSSRRQLASTAALAAGAEPPGAEPPAPEDAPRAGGKTRVFALLSLGVIGSFAAGFALRTSAPEAPAPAASGPAASAASAPAASAPVAPAASAPADPPPASASAVARAPEAPAAKTKGPGDPAARPAKTGEPAKTKKADCSVPWYLDARGIRRIRPECQ